MSFFLTDDNTNDDRSSSSVELEASKKCNCHHLDYNGWVGLFLRRFSTRDEVKNGVVGGVFALTLKPPSNTHSFHQSWLLLD